MLTPLRSELPACGSLPGMGVLEGPGGTPEIEREREAVLLADLRVGEEEAFETLVQAYTGRVESRETLSPKRGGRPRRGARNVSLCIPFDRPFSRRSATLHLAPPHRGQRCPHEA